MSDDQDGCEWVNVFLVPAYPGSPGPTAVKRLCVCVCVCVYVLLEHLRVAWVTPVTYVVLSVADAAVLAQLTAPAVSLIRSRQLVRTQTERVECLAADAAVHQLSVHQNEQKAVRKELQRKATSQGAVSPKLSHWIHGSLSRPKSISQSVQLFVQESLYLPYNKLGDAPPKNYSFPGST